MQQDIADLIYPVISKGLALKARVSAGENVDLISAQALFMELLKVDDSSIGGSDFCGDIQRAGSLGSMPRRAMDTSMLPEQFQGTRYALVCWLDELFTDESAWGRRWNENKLEMELYGSNDRAWKFWSQARLAQARPTTTALEVFYLCAMLGFRGDLRDQPAEFGKWVAGAKRRLGEISEMDWPMATELEPPTDVPPLRGRLHLKQLIAAACVVFLVSIPALAFLAVHHLAE